MAYVGSVEALQDLVNDLPEARPALLDVDHVTVVGTLDVRVEPAYEVRLAGPRLTDDRHDPVAFVVWVAADERFEHFVFVDPLAGVGGPAADVFAKHGGGPVDRAEYRGRVTVRVIDECPPDLALVPTGNSLHCASLKTTWVTALWPTLSDPPPKSARRSRRSFPARSARSRASASAGEIARGFSSAWM